MRTETIHPPELARAEARLPRWMIALAFGCALATLLRGQVREAAGFALGATVSILNYFWLHQAVDYLLDRGSSRPPRAVIAKFALRYPLAVTGVYLLYRTGWLPVAPVLAGLFVAVGGVLIEAVIQMREAWRQS